MKRRLVKALAVFVAVAGLTGCGITTGDDGSSLSIIGGADGPTSIFLGRGSGDSEFSTEQASEDDYSDEDYLTFGDDLKKDASDAEDASSFEDDLRFDDYDDDDETESDGARTYTEADLRLLKNTEIFLPSTIDHIFLGTINKKGNATGYHYEGIEGSPGEVIEGTRGEPDSFGVYSGRVRVKGILKSGNKGYSTFYPKYMSPQEVIDVINEAYASRELLEGNLYAGLTDAGMEIDMALTDDNKIITAYPVMED